MTLWTAKELSKLAVRRQKIELISDSQLCYVLFNTVYAHFLNWCEEKGMYCFDLTTMEQFTLFEGFYWDARRVYVDPDKEKIVIEMESEEEFHSDCARHDRPDYDLAKLHLQVCMSYYAPGLGHNYVHFVFPSAVCIYAKRHLSESSFLYKLLAPHFRFMERLNYQALRICHASSNTRTLFDRGFCFWKPFPVTKEQFSSKMASQLEKYYIELGSKDYSAEVKESPPEETSRASKSVKPQKREHSIFPPTFVDNQDMQKIPYFSYLSQYYSVIRQFIAEMEPFIDTDEWTQLQTSISRHVPRFERVNKVDAIATFIHLVAIVHSADHSSYTDFFARSHGCMSIRTPFEKFSNKEFWSSFQAETGTPVDAIKKNPVRLIRQRDVMRMRCFLNVFVDYVPSPTCDLSLVKTNYDFQNNEADILVRNFISKLRCLDGNLKIQESPLKFTRNENDFRPSGLQIAKLDTLVRSNCY
ncbi:uncharacterized protein LOC143468684 isoform X2 [Clavelina lepadiformis]